MTTAKPTTPQDLPIKRHTLDRLPERLTNASTREPLNLASVMHPSGMRPGCDQHKQYRSRGHGC